MGVFSLSYNSVKSRTKCEKLEKKQQEWLILRFLIYTRTFDAKFKNLTF
jgi:hypothetical protein